MATDRERKQLAIKYIASRENELNVRGKSEFEALEEIIAGEKDPLTIATAKEILGIRRERERRTNRAVSGRPEGRHAKSAAPVSPNRKA
jgi:hypothetical protein